MATKKERNITTHSLHYLSIDDSLRHHRTRALCAFALPVEFDQPKKRESKRFGLIDKLIFCCCRCCWLLTLSLLLLLPLLKVLFVNRQPKKIGKGESFVCNFHIDLLQMTK